MLNFIICDDEIHILNKLSQMFEKAFLKNDLDGKVVLKTTNYRDIFAYMNRNIVNVVVLDIEFKDSKLTGLDIAKKIREINKDCYIIFTTSHFEYVMEAYKFKTFDYLIKNSITIDSLSNTLNRLYDDFSNTKSRFLKIDSKGTFVDLNDILFIEKNGMKLIYHCLHNDFSVYESFSKILPLLPENFVRCHKSFIANINNIAHISSNNNSIMFKDSSVCYIGPKYKNCFMEVINYDTIFR